MLRRKKKKTGGHIPSEKILAGGDFACIAFYAGWAAFYFHTPDIYMDKFQAAYVGILGEFRRQQKGERKRIPWHYWWWWSQVAKHKVLWFLSYRHPKPIRLTHKAWMEQRDRECSGEIDEDPPQKFFSSLPKHLLGVMVDVVGGEDFNEIARKRRLSLGSLRVYTIELRRRFDAMYRFEDCIPACRQRRPK